MQLLLALDYFLLFYSIFLYLKMSKLFLNCHDRPITRYKIKLQMIKVEYKSVLVDRSILHKMKSGMQILTKILKIHLEELLKITSIQLLGSYLDASKMYRISILSYHLVL